MTNIRDWDEDDWLGVSVVVAIFVVIALVLTALTANHKVQFYYVGLPGDGVYTGTTCIYAANPWESDDKVYCSTDTQKTLAFMQAANAELAKVSK